MMKEKKFLSDDIIKAIAYFDLFSYPLTVEQVYNFLPRNSVTPEDIGAALDEMVCDNALARYGGFYTLRLSDQHIVQERKENEARARRLIKYARFVTQVLKRFPFVRAVFITGSLSKNVATKESDIDFMIVTAQRRLWICKTILTLFRKIFLFGSNKYFCTNYYISEKNYTYQDRNIFSAIEIATTKAAWNTEAFKKYLEANVWIGDYLPNYGTNTDAPFAVDEKRLWFQRIVEAALSVLPLTWIDTSVMNYFNRHWRRKYYNLNAKKRDSLFLTTPDASSVWKTDQQDIILDRYSKKLHELGLA